MRAVVTRVSRASVKVNKATVGKIDRGFLILLAVAPDDSEKDVEFLADKICRVRIFNDENGKMNLDLATVGGSLLIISQFTLYADLKSRRPGFSKAAKPELARNLYEKFIEACSKNFHVEHGEFGADMQVESVNDGPVTLLFDSKNL